jgi:salicylate hydroxylase
MHGKPHVLIAGAGMGGLALALALLRRGFRVSVFEQVPQLGEIGAGFMCSPNGTRVLYSLGLQDAIEKIEVRLADRDIRLWNTGQLWRLPGHGADSSKRYGAPFLVLHRGDLHAVLVDAVRKFGADVLHVGARCVGFSQGPSGVTLELEGGRQVQGDVLIGADGVHSVVRQRLLGADNPIFTGEVAWRGLIPMADLPERMRGKVTSNWIGPRGSVTMYPVRRAELLNFVGLVERSDWRVESWIEQGTTDECVRDFTGWHDDIQFLIRRIEAPYKFALFLREPLARWSVGRVSLLGDACHATTPYLGQGLNMALEDAVVLARCLERFDDAERALARYEELRRQRTTEIVHQSTEQSKRIHDPILADPIAATPYVEANWAPSQIKQRYDWIFDYDAERVAL